MGEVDVQGGRCRRLLDFGLIEAMYDDLASRVEATEARRSAGPARWIGQALELLALLS